MKKRFKSKLISGLLVVAMSISCLPILSISAGASTLSTTFNPTDDSFIRGGVTTSNGSAQTLELKTSDTNNTRKIYFKFDMTSFAHPVQSAKLRIYGKQVTTGAASTVGAYQITNDSWSENTILWGNAPAMSSLINSIAISTTQKYYEFDVTSFVLDQMSGDKMISICLSSITTEKNFTFNSKEASSNLPQLLVEYEDAIPTSSTISNVTKITGGYNVQYSFTLGTGISSSKNLVALYNGNDLKAVQLVDSGTTTVNFTTDEPITKARIFIWDSFSTIKPLCASPEYGVN